MRSVLKDPFHMSSRVISLTWAKEISENDTKSIEKRGFRSIELNVKMTSILLKKNQNSAFTKYLIFNLTIAFSYNG